MWSETSLPYATTHRSRLLISATSLATSRSGRLRVSFKGYTFPSERGGSALHQRGKRAMKAIRFELRSKHVRCESRRCPRKATQEVWDDNHVINDREPRRRQYFYCEKHER